jgi:hypothetical protein
MTEVNETKVEEIKQIILTEIQFKKLLKIRELLDESSETLDAIDGDSDSLFNIGKQVSSAFGDIVHAYNELSIIINELDPIDYYDDELVFFLFTALVGRAQ